MLGYYLTNKKVTFNWKNTKPTEIVKTDRKRKRRRQREGDGGGGGGGEGGGGGRERRIKCSVSQLNDLLRPPQTISVHNFSLAPHSSDVL